ncbi:hypothetical protein [Caulobacter sp. 17J80-11]|uniref:hypothetical protein n=1 Tax=Caulobacter sp. 17J80-11 TaxID=2763502 RepID=UPI0016534F7C|nr:hypothetical protein [Caulobacter sp. 17J80-11]MBC6983507.1 hypothetical protein [Caulobacter sp. 17J80-11]
MNRIDRAGTFSGFAVLTALALLAAGPACADGVKVATPSASVSAHDGALESYALGFSGDWWMGGRSGGFASGVEGQDLRDPAVWTRLRAGTAEGGVRWSGDQPQVDLGFSWRAPVGLLPKRDFVSLSPTVDWTPEGEALALRSELGVAHLPRTDFSLEQGRDGGRRAAMGVTARAREFGVRVEAAADQDGRASEIRLRFVR